MRTITVQTNKTQAISRPDPGTLDNEALAKYVAGVAGSIAAQLEGLQPYYIELRGRFHHIKKNETILDCNSWEEYCDRVLHRTRRAVNYWLAGGNPVSKRLPAAPEWETVSHLPTALENAIDQLTPYHSLRGQSVCWCGESCVECEHANEDEYGSLLLIEPSAHDGEFFWIMVVDGSNLVGNKKAVAKRGLGLFINSMISQGSLRRMAFEVFEIGLDYERKNYNQWLFFERSISESH